MKNKRYWILLSLLTLISTLLAACGPQATPEPIIETVVVMEEGKEVVKVVTTTPDPSMIEPTQKLLRVNLGTYPDIIDPQQSSFSNEIAHLELIYEGLTALDKDLETVPGAAESWQYNENATELTFTLREGLVYSDGTVLNAMRFKDALMRNINPATAGEYAGSTDEILGAAEWRLGEGDASEAGKAVVEKSILAMDMAGNECTDYEQTDCRTLKLALVKPAPYYHTVMAIWVAFPAKKELIEEGGENWWNSSVYQIGNGPYILRNLEPFVRSYFVPNPNYWGGQGIVDIEFRFITDTAVEFEAYKNNEFDIVRLASEDFATVKNDPVLSLEQKIFPGSCTYNIFFHQLKEPFTDIKVREAFARALDRATYVTDVLQNLGAPTLTWIPPGFPGYDPTEDRWSYDPPAAVQALKDSSYGSVEALPDIVATFGDTPRNRIRWEWLVNKWKEVLGVDISLNPVEPTTFTALTNDVNTAPQMFLLGWCADYPDPQNWLSIYWMSTSALANRIGYVNTDLDALMSAADVEPNPDVRMKLYYDAQKLLVTSLPGAFMYNNVNSFLVKPWVKNLELTPQDSSWPGRINPLVIDIDTSMLP